MSQVVERCPSCGVEHESGGGCCEACGAALRPWCRRHGRETGWLPGPDCPRCAQEAARPPAARARATAPAPPPSAATSGPFPPEPSPWPGRSPREILRGGPTPREPAKPAVHASPDPVRKVDQNSISYAIGEVLGTGLVGWIIGAVLGLAAGLLMGENAILVGRAGGQLFGLAGLVVGLIQTIARRVARRAE